MLTRFVSFPEEREQADVGRVGFAQGIDQGGESVVTGGSLATASQGNKKPARSGFCRRTGQVIQAGFCCPQSVYARQRSGRCPVF